METTASRFLPAPAMAAGEDLDVERPPAKKKKPSLGQKRPPQRGLGVEKLERLRLQERWRMMTEMETPAIPRSEHQIQRSSIYEDKRHKQALLPHSPFLQQCGGSIRMGFPAAIGAQNQAIMAEEAWLLQQNRMLRPGGVFGNGGAFGFSCAPVKHAIGSSFELPSSQKFPLTERHDAGSSEEKHTRPKSLSAAAELAFFETNEDRNQRASDTKLYEFFPGSSSSKSKEESEVPSSGVARSGKETHLDLTLKLSSQ